MAWILQITLLIMGLHGSLCVDMEAKISMAGFVATAELRRSRGQLSTGMIFTDADGVQYDKWEVWSLPAVFGGHDNATEVCKSKVGTKLRDLDTANPADIPETEYFHRTFVTYSTNTTLPRLCATIFPTTGFMTSYRAKFIGPVFGSVWLRHHSTLGTFVYGDLVTVSASDTVVRDLATFPTGSVSDSGAFTSRCSRLSGTMETVDAGVSVKNSTLSDGAFGFITPSFTTTRTNLAVMNGETIVACATLRTVTSKTVTSVMDWEGVDGSFTFTQASPFDLTTTSVNLRGLASRTSGYHVHKFPVPQRLSASENPCSAQFVSGHFNPYGVDVQASPAAGTGTEDEYEIGDLSGKYGTLTGKDIEQSETYEDWNLPLFGVNSIVGRSIVIHNSDGSRLLCSSIGYPSPVVSGISVFKAPAYGTMYFRQPSSNPDEDTSVFIELASQSKAVTNSHNWHVHVSPVHDDAFSTTGTCASAGGHYNPSGVDVADPYKTECRAQDPLRCELGDLSGRLGGVNIVSTQRTEAGKFFFTDEYLPLSGAFSVLGRSVVVHGANAAAARYACANITQLQPTVAQTAGTWVGTSDGSASGTMTLEQATEFDQTKVTGSFSNLQGLASGYHIHEYTISTSAASGSQCASSSVAGHYNPFNWTATTAAQTGTYDQYEVGDLSNKYGLLDGANDFPIPANIMDTNLPLHTYLSASDRSIVIHKADQGARWKCANLITQPPTGSNGYAISATVTFSTNVTGTIKLRQIVYEDGGAGMTSYEVDVSPKSDTANTPQHNWHIHVDPVTDQTMCAGAEGHYDPYSAIDNTDYSTDCKPENPLFCEVGDLSNKQAKYDIGSGRKTFHDVDTPLHTNFTVLGRSIVFHVSNGGSPRYTCANIIPDDYTYTLAFPLNENFHRYTFTKTVADALGINRMRVVIIHNIDVPVSTPNKDGCSRVMIHIAGGGSVDSNKLSQLTSGTLSGLGVYAPTAKCVSTTGADVLGQKSGAGMNKYRHWALILVFVVTSFLSKYF